MMEVREPGPPFPAALPHLPLLCSFRGQVRVSWLSNPWAPDWAVPAQFSSGAHRHLTRHVLALVSLSLMSPAVGQTGPESMLAAEQFFGVNFVSLHISGETRH